MKFLYHAVGIELGYKEFLPNSIPTREVLNFCRCINISILFKPLTFTHYNINCTTKETSYDKLFFFQLNHLAVICVVQTTLHFSAIAQATPYCTYQSPQQCLCTACRPAPLPTLSSPTYLNGYYTFLTLALTYLLCGNLKWQIEIFKNYLKNYVLLNFNIRKTQVMFFRWDSQFWCYDTFIHFQNTMYTAAKINSLLSVLVQ